MDSGVHFEEQETVELPIFDDNSFMMEVVDPGVEYRPTSMDDGGIGRAQGRHRDATAYLQRNEFIQPVNEMREEPTGYGVEGYVGTPYNVSPQGASSTIPASSVGMLPPSRMLPRTMERETENIYNHQRAISQ